MSNQFEILRYLGNKSSKRKLQEQYQSTDIDEKPIVITEDITHDTRPDKPTKIAAHQVQTKPNQIQTHLFKTNNPFVFYGRAEMRVVRGQVSVFGHDMDAKSKPVSIYNPFTHTPIAIFSQIKDESSRPHSDKMDYCETVIQLASLTDDGFDGMENCLSGSTIWTPAVNSQYSKLLSNVYVPKTPCPFIITPESWHMLANDSLQLDEEATFASVAICGSKNMGKSTFSRFLLNKWLGKYDSVCYLEADVGQCEFAPAGLMTLNLVSSPLLGPPFTHINIQHARMYGRTTPEPDPFHYFACFASLWDLYLTKYAPFGVPIILNTNGWIKGIGQDLLFQMLQHTRPRHVIQFVPAGPDGQINTADIVINEMKNEVKSLWIADWICTPNEDDIISWNPKLVFLPPSLDPSTNSKPRLLPAPDHRLLSFLTYFAQRPSGKRDFTPLTQMLPLYLPLSMTEVIMPNVPTKEDHILSLLNCSFIAILDSEERILTKDPSEILSALEVKAIGIVRAIKNKEQDMGIYVLTPVSIEYLNHDESKAAKISRFHYDIPLQMMFQSTSLTSGPFTERKSLDGVIGHSVLKLRRNLPRLNACKKFE